MLFDSGYILRGFFVEVEMEKKGKILLVDDDADFILANRIVLEANQYEVIEAATREEGSRKAKEEKPDLIVLDVAMDMKDDGFYLTQTLRKDPETSKIPILMVTAIHQMTRHRFSPETDGEYLPVDQFIEKPIDPEDLLKKIDSYLR